MLFSRRFITIFIIAVLTTCNIGVFFLFPLYINDRGGTAADIGYIMGVFALASVLSRPLISEAINRLGRKRSYSLANMTMVVTSISYLFFPGDLKDFYLPLLIVRAVHGISAGFTFTAGFTYAADIIPEDRMNEGIGIYGASGLLGFATGPVLAEVIINHFGFSAYFLSAAIPPALGGFLLFFLPETCVVGQNRTEGSFLAVLKNYKIVVVAVLSIIVGSGVASINSFVALFAHSRGIEFVSAFFIAYSMAAIGVRLTCGKIADRVGEGKVIPLGLVISAAGLIIIIFINSVVFLVFTGLVLGAAQGILFPSLNTMAIRRESVSLRAKVLAVVTGAYELGMFVGAVVMGQIGKHFGFPAIFLIAGLAFFAGVAVYRVGLSGKKSPARV